MCVCMSVCHARVCHPKIFTLMILGWYIERHHSNLTAHMPITDCVHTGVRVRVGWS